MEYGIFSIIPPVLTIVLALVLKNVYVALLSGIFLASLTLAGGNIIVGLNSSFYGIVKTFAGSGNVIVILSILMIGAFIHLIERSGGVKGFMEMMVEKRSIISSKKTAAFFTWLLGIIVFTSGSLSCMLTGSVARPLNDSMKVSHEKAAFLVHTTSTPWCVLLPLSGWLAAMVGYLTSGGVNEADAINTLLASIPLNFYCIIAVVFALLSTFLPLDFGPMRQAEKRADTTGELDDPETSSASRKSKVEDIPDMKPHAINMFLPILIMVGTILAVLIVTGKGNPTRGSGMQALLWGCSISLLSICFMCLVERVFTLEELTSEVLDGMKGMLPIAIVLTLAFTMGTLVKGLDTGHYLSSLFAGFLTPALLPALTFIMAMLLSFATGTSMGTMAIMAVLALPMAINMDVNIPLTAGALFGGSIFGDHASPVSDTTIMSCASTGCDIMDHIKTQMPYVLCFAGISLVLYIILGFIM